MILNAAWGIAAAVWLCGIIAALLALRWTFSQRLRPVARVFAVLIALAVGYVGLTQFQMAASKTVNGVTQWRFDSRWFFGALLVLAVIALAGVLWKQFMLGRRNAVPQ